MTTDATKSPDKRAALSVVCADCEVHKELEDANQAVAFYRRHRSITGHDVEWVRADEVPTVAPEADLEEVIAALEGRFENGVPIGVVTAVMSARGHTIGETLSAIRELRLAGGLYEPRDDRLRVT